MLPSLHVVPFGAAGFEQIPVDVLQVPATWHWSLPPHVTGFEPVHVPDWHVSVWVHAFPSLQAAPLAFATAVGQPVAGTHAPTVWHWSAPAQVTAEPPVQVPLWQLSPLVHAFPSLQVVPLAAFASAGQAFEVPEHFSATSHIPTAARQTVAAGLTASAGQAFEAPVHFSATSQPPATAARQTVDDGMNPSAGQAAAVPVQFSATSQPPATAARQTVDDDMNLSAGQATDVPVQFSATSQMPADPRQDVDDDASLSAGQAADVPVQFSATSQAPADGRQAFDDAANPSAGQASEVPLHVSATSQTPADARQVLDPLATGEQTPLLAAVQAPQASPQAVLQQMPETQWLFRHSVLELQV
jgi:hypothetical protein